METKSLSIALTLLNRARPTLIAVLVLVSPALAQAAQEGGEGGISLIAWLFIVFFSVIVALQLIPAIVMFVSLLIAVFRGAEKTTDAVSQDLAGPNGP